MEMSIRVVYGINEIDANIWDELSMGQPFQSHKWYQYGEKVLDDCAPMYLLVYRGEVLIGRASFWLTRNEPLPQFAGIWQMPLKIILKRWPLLICRSPLSSMTGIVTTLEEDREEILRVISVEAIEQAYKLNCSALMFDFIPSADANTWMKGFSILKFPDVGTYMKNRWKDFDDYIATGDARNRKNYRRTMRESVKFEIDARHHVTEEEIEMLLPLVNHVDKLYGSMPNPWVKNMVRYMEMADGQLVTVIHDNKIIACSLMLEDRQVQLTTAFGRRTMQPFVYMMVVYKNLEVAFSRKVQAFRWGSGVYDIKKKLGFGLEDNGFVAFYPVQPFLRIISRWFA